MGCVEKGFEEILATPAKWDPLYQYLLARRFAVAILCCNDVRCSVFLARDICSLANSIFVQKRIIQIVDIFSWVAIAFVNYPLN